MKLIIKFKVNPWVSLVLVSLMIVTILVPSISCQPLRSRVREGPHHGKSQQSDSGNRHDKRSTSKYRCEETEEDIALLNKKIAKSCKCPLTYAPVCGSDGKTWHNRCFIHCAAQEKYQRFYHGKQLTVTKMEPCATDHIKERGI